MSVTNRLNGVENNLQITASNNQTNEAQGTNDPPKRKLHSLIECNENERSVKKREIEKTAILNLADDLLQCISEQGLQVAHFSSFMRTCKKVYDLLELRMNELKQNYLLNAQFLFDIYMPKLQINNDDEMDSEIKENYAEELKKMVELYAVDEPKKAIEYLNKIITVAPNDDSKDLICNFLNRQKFDAERIAELISKIDNEYYSVVTEACLEFMLELAGRNVDQLIALMRALIKTKTLEKLENFEIETPIGEEYSQKIGREIVSSCGCEKSLEYFREFSDSEIGQGMIYNVIAKFGYSHSREIQEVIEDLEEKWMDDHSYDVRIRHAIISHLLRLNSEKTMQMISKYFESISHPDEVKGDFVEDYLITDFELALIVFDSMDQDSREYLQIKNRVQARLESLISELIPTDLDRALAYTERMLDIEKRDLSYVQIVEKLLPLDQKKAIEVFEKVGDKKKGMNFILSKRAERNAFL